MISLPSPFDSLLLPSWTSPRQCSSTPVNGLGQSHMYECTFGVGTHGQLSKKPHHVLDSTYRTGVRLDTFFNSNPCDLILLHWFLQGYLYLFKISYRAEVVTSPRRSVTTTSELTSAGCHLTRSVSDLGWACQKVHLYSTFVSGLRHSPPQMKNQHGPNEEKSFIGKNSLSVECLWCHTRS